MAAIADNTSNALDIDACSSAAGVVNDGTGVVKLDPWLSPFSDVLRRRYSKAQAWIQTINDAKGGIEKFSMGVERFGFNVDGHNNIIYREWAPNAKEAFLIGDFNDWNRESHAMRRDAFGVFEITVPTLNGQPAIAHNSKVKVSVVGQGGERAEHIPAWIKYITQDLSVSPVYDARFWNPPPEEKYHFRHCRPKKPISAHVYEAHVGISTPEQRVATYKEFTQNMLPRIKGLGYNVIQLMAVMEHAYYASFGYQVNSFAASSRYGPPEDLKELIETAHGMGLTILLDIVHSHASKNVMDGLNEFDGSDHQYFHGGGKGRHDQWDSRLFNYGHHEVLRYLLSNLRYWMDEYQFDGLSFDDVTSMLYVHTGWELAFQAATTNISAARSTKRQSCTFMLANEMLHSLYPQCITIAEDVSGMPALCLPLSLGGIGFDYRLAMAIPDMWIKIRKELRDEQ